LRRLQTALATADERPSGGPLAAKVYLYLRAAATPQMRAARCEEASCARGEEESRGEQRRGEARRVRRREQEMNDMVKKVIQRLDLAELATCCTQAERLPLAPAARSIGPSPRPDHPRRPPPSESRKPH